MVNKHIFKEKMNRNSFFIISSLAILFACESIEEDSDTLPCPYFKIADDEQTINISEANWDAEKTWNYRIEVFKKNKHNRTIYLRDDSFNSLNGVTVSFRDTLADGRIKYTSYNQSGKEEIGYGEPITTDDGYPKLGEFNTVWISANDYEQYRYGEDNKLRTVYKSEGGDLRYEYAFKYNDQSQLSEVIFTDHTPFGIRTWTNRIEYLNGILNKIYANDKLIYEFTVEANQITQINYHNSSSANSYKRYLTYQNNWLIGDKRVYEDGEHTFSYMVQETPFRLLKFEESGSGSTNWGTAPWVKYQSFKFDQYNRLTEVDSHATIPKVKFEYSDMSLPSWQESEYYNSIAETYQYNCIVNRPEVYTLGKNLHLFKQLNYLKP
jgi:hypothetical protein